MKRVNLDDPAFTYDGRDPAGFRPGMFRFGPQLGAERSGASLYELPPGEALCPYHYEWGEEEWLLVLRGRPTVRHAEGVEELGPWDTMCFAVGPAGAHQVRNDTAETGACSCGRPSSCRRRPSIPTATRSRSGPGRRRTT